jgi:hypothetical protein
MKTPTKEEIQDAVAKLVKAGLITIRPPDARAIDTLKRIVYAEQKARR